MTPPTDLAAADNADTAELLQRAAAALAWFVGGLGLLLCLAALAQGVLQERAPGAAVARGLFGAALAAAGLAAHRLIAMRRTAPAVALLLVVATVGAGVATVGVGVGASGVAVPGITLLIVISGLLAGERAVHLLTLLYLALVGALSWAEHAGHLAGAQALTALGVGDRAINLLLLGLGPGWRHCWRAGWWPAAWSAHAASRRAWVRWCAWAATGNGRWTPAAG